MSITNSATHGSFAVDDTWRKEEGMLDLLPVGAMVVDSGLRILKWNHTLADWTGVNAREAIGVALTELFPKIAEPKYLSRLTEVFTTGLPVTYSASFHKHFLPIRSRDCPDRELMIQQTQVRRLPEQEHLALITIQDVTFHYVQLDRLKSERKALVRTRDELERTNATLREKNQDLEDFTNSVSHDLQAPLRHVASFVELLEEDSADELSDENKQYLTRMKRATDRMQSLIKDLLVLSRLGTAGVRMETVNLNETIDDILKLLGVDDRAEVIVDPLPPVHGDGRLISQLFQNLIGNALKFVDHESPRIEITASYEEGSWVFGVKDNGIGLDTRFAERIFKPFQRLHSQREFEGTGIGLSICKKAVRRHGGEIWVESQPGEGAHFRFTLPVDSADASMNHPPTDGYKLASTPI